VILIKELLYRVIRKKSKITQSTALKADAWHHRSDALTSAAAFIGISLALFFGEGWEAADDWAALIVSGIILYNCYMIFRPALGEIMDEHMYDELVDKIRRISLTIPGVITTEKCLIRKTGMRYLVDLHAEVDGSIPVSEGHHIAHTLKDALLAELPELADVLIHIEPHRQTS
jgi:cation diffusion facilitator family transporter